MISIHSPASRHHPLNDFARSLLLAEIILAPGSGSVPSHIAGDRNLHRNYRKNRSARTFMPSSLSTVLTVTLNSVALAFPSHTSTFLRNTPLARSPSSRLKFVVIGQTISKTEEKMKYVISWFERPQGSPTEYENAQKRILEVFGQWKAPANFKIEFFVVRVGEWGGHMLLDCDDPLTIHKFCSMLPAFVFRVHPVVRVEDAVRGELEVIAWRDGLKGK